MGWRNWASLALCLVGSAQIAGHFLGSKPLKGLGAATALSPYPKVFSDAEGLETFASQFTLQIMTASGQEIQEPITPELYRRLAGPYNRRNVYGAALSYAPRLPEPLWRAVFCYGLRPGGPLRTELGLPGDAVRISVLIRTKTRGRSGSWLLEDACTG